ncbi:hypothetical protein TIFTF001_052639 [Ficus carica]|uniref:Uncharacterized protein n=1 Tax=Ficus carica TaxID=3494 RepID=A0AA88JBY9_FICCA|nr:hypothetical protein TIFTF001_052639 [Ficus carica]
MMDGNREGYPSYWTRFKTQGYLMYVICYGMLWHVMVCMITNNESRDKNKTSKMLCRTDLPRGRKGLPPSTIPWLCTMVSNLPSISDAILWKAGAADCEMWNGHRHKF